MAPSINSQSSNYEARLLLAIQALEQGQFQSVREAAKAYSVNRNTLSNRRAGVSSRRDCTLTMRKLTDLEESVIVQYILDLDSRGFSPRVSAIADMANKLLAARAGGTVGVNWPTTFIKRQPELKTRFNRKYDYKRALCEDPAIIQPWFDLVRNTIAKHGILDDDIYNFDETGFMMGMISTAMVVTASERRNRPNTVQPGNREWATVIQGINSQGWAIPPFIIFKGQCLLSTWFEEDIPPNWVLAVSENGWTTNELGLNWLKHFNKHTKQRTKGVKRLLVLDGHESHNSVEFNQYCEENSIVTLCMPAHSSHLLQPLDVGCFAPLKQAYGRQVEGLIRLHINHVTKLEFLPAFKQAYQEAIANENIISSFRGAGLVPFNPEAVLLKLDIKLRTLTPPTLDTTP